MLPVSQHFQDQVKATVRRIFARVIVDYTDPFIDQSITASANEQINPSYPNQTADAVQEPTRKYASLDGSCVPDGSYYPAPSSENSGQMGWWGSTLAVEGGAFLAPYPMLTVNFFSRPIHSLKVVGDSARVEYPVDFVIQLYNSFGSVLHTETVTGNALVSWTKLLDTSINSVVKMTLEIQKWSHAGRQVKILEFFTSIQETYEGNDILLVNLLEERDVSQGSLPIGNISANEIEVQLNNIDHRFDAGNTQSPLYELLKANRRIRPWLGIEVENVDSNTPSVFTRNSTAYKSDGSQVITGEPRFENGGLLIEENTANLLTANQSNVETDTSGFNPSGDITLTRDTTEKWTGEAGLKVVTLGNAANEGFSTTYNSTINTPYTGSAYLKGNGTVSVKLRVNYNDSTYTESAENIVTLNQVWQRVVFSITPTSGKTVTNYQLFFTTPTPQATTFYADGLQLEQKRYSTSWYPPGSPRSAEILTISTTDISPTEGTWEQMTYFHQGMKTFTMSPPYIFRIPRGNLVSSNGIGLYRNSGTNSWFLVNSSDDGSLSTVSIPDNTISDGWHRIGVTWKSTSVKLFVDGVLMATISGENRRICSSFYPNAYIGSIHNGTFSCNTYHKDICISNVARTDAEMQSRGTLDSLSLDEHTTYLLPLKSSLFPMENCWVPLGTFWSGDWKVPEKEIYAHTSGRDRMELLRKTTYSAGQVQINVTLYNLAIDVLEDAGLTPEEYWVDPELQNYLVPYAWFEPQSHREALRKIAESCLGQAYCGRNGITRIEGPSFLESKNSSELTITNDDIWDKDNPVSWSEIANYIEVTTNPLRTVDVPEEVYRSNSTFEVPAGGQKTITAYYNLIPCIETVASLDGATNTAISSATYYAWGASITLNNSGGTIENVTVVINGKPLKVLNKEKAIAQDADSIIDNGKLKYTFPENSLIQTLAVAQTIADKILAVFKDPRRDIELDWRGNPALELADRITAPDYKNVSMQEYHVISQTMEYDGGLRSKIIGRRAT